MGGFWRILVERLSSRLIPIRRIAAGTADWVGEFASMPFVATAEAF